MIKTVQLTGIKKMQEGIKPMPAIINNTDVLLKIASIGVCGSDIHYYTEGKIGSQVVDYPFIVGHECSGIVVEIGSEVTHLKEGDLVVVDPAIHCGTCDQCNAGRPHTCRNNRFLGCPGQIEGCLSEYLIMPGFTCFPVTGKMNPVQAALIEPFTIGVYAVNLAKIENINSSIGIFGSGPIGLSVLLKLKADGISNIGMIEPLEYRLQKAKELGVKYALSSDNEDLLLKISENEPLLLDVVFEASGEQAAVDNAIRILKPGGKLVLIGIPPAASYSFDMDNMRRKEITIINVRRQNHSVEEAIDLVTSGKVDIEKMVTHYFNFDETHKAFEIVEGYKDGVIKAMINL